MRIMLQPTRLSGGRVTTGGEAPSFGPVRKPQ